MGNTRTTVQHTHFDSLYLHMGIEGLKKRDGGWVGGGGSRINPPTESNCLVVVTAPLNTDNHTVKLKLKRRTVIKHFIFIALF